MIDAADAGTGASQRASSSYPLALIRSQLASLSPSEARVATTILERPYDAMYWSAADLGANSSTSAATAVRTCRKLGFDGLQELRLELARDLKWGNDDHDGKPVAPVAILAEMVAMATKTMEGIVTSVNAQSFDRIVTLVRRARRVLLVATGDTHALCSDLAFRLTSAGRPAEFSPDSISQHISAALLGPKDVCIAISNSGSNGLTLRAVDGARSAGATVIAITASPKSRLVAIADHSLIVGGFDASLGMQTAVNSVVFLLTLRALTMAVGSRLSTKDAVAVQNVLDTIAGYHYR